MLSNLHFLALYIWAILESFNFFWGGPDTEEERFMSTPYRLLLEKQRRAAVALREQDADLLQRLEKAGFLGFLVI